MNRWIDDDGDESFDRMRDDKLTDAADRFAAEMKAAKEKARIEFHERTRPSGNQFDGIFMDGFDAGYLAGYERHIDQVAATFQKIMPKHEGLVEVTKE